LGAVELLELYGRLDLPAPSEATCLLRRQLVP